MQRLKTDHGIGNRSREHVSVKTFYFAPPCSEQREACELREPDCCLTEKEWRRVKGEARKEGKV